MSKAIVIYESKYGNTKQIAEAIAEGVLEQTGAEAVVCHRKRVDPGQLSEFDGVVIGSPNHIGTATYGIRRFINALGKADLDGRLVTVFDTYINGDAGKAVSKMEKRLADRAPSLETVSPGLSVRVDGIRGPVSDGEVSRSRTFGAMLAKRMKERSTR